MLYEDSANNWLPSQGYLYNYTDIDIDLNKVDLRIFRGNISIVSNVASFWGLTPATYTFYTALYTKLVSRGFSILAYPCNQFGNQEPNDNEWIKDFIRVKYGGMYPIFNKTLVNEGEGEVHPAFKFLKTAFKGELEWNFVKFIVDHNGVPLKRFSTGVDEFPAVEKFILQMLDQRDALYNGTMVPIIGP